MSSDADKDLIRSYIQSESMDATARYVNLGRAHKDLSDEALQAAWAATFKSIAFDDASSDRLMELTCELSVRGLGVTGGLTKQDLDEMVRKLSGLGPFSDEAEADLAGKVAAYQRSKSTGAN